MMGLFPVAKDIYINPISLGRKSVICGKIDRITRPASIAINMGITGGVNSSIVKSLILHPTYRLTATGA